MSAVKKAYVITRYSNIDYFNYALFVFILPTLFCKCVKRYYCAVTHFLYT